MNEELFSDQINAIDYTADHSKEDIIDKITSLANQHNYRVAEINIDKPWGGYLRFDSEDADRFVEEFFPELDATEARLGDSSASLSPKILLVSPGERLSWQYHDRRAERWKFLTPGKYFASQTDELGVAQIATVGTSLQLERSQRHRLVGMPGAYVVVAEIWQHTDSDNLSDEDDIVRLQDDYQR